MAQQTALTWLIHQVDKYTSAGVQVPNQMLSKLLIKAKQMESKQFEEEYKRGIENYHKEKIKEIYNK